MHVSACVHDNQAYTHVKEDTAGVHLACVCAWTPPIQCDTEKSVSVLKRRIHGSSKE